MKIGLFCNDCGDSLHDATRSPKYEVEDELKGGCPCGEQPFYFNDDKCRKSYDWYACLF